MGSHGLLGISLSIIAFATVAGMRAHAEDGAVNTTIVHYRDLDLSTPEGVATLNRRIAYAAEKDCWQANGPTLAEHERYAACRSVALASAQPKENAVIAAARTNNRNGGGGAIAVAVVAP